MDELLTISIWAIIILLTTSFVTNWMVDYPGITDFNLGLDNYKQHTNAVSDTNAYQNIVCSMTVITDAPLYTWCFIGKVTSPILGLVSAIWDLATGWTTLIDAIFGYNPVNGTYLVPAGNLFAGLLKFFFSAIEIAAAIVIMMRLAAIIRGAG